MIWIILVLAVLCIAMSCVAYWYRHKWLRSENLSKRRLEAFEEVCNKRDALGVKICELRDKHTTDILHLNAQLENERFDKGIFEQRWKNAVEELMELRESLPKRNSKGRFCKK